MEKKPRCFFISWKWFEGKINDLYKLQQNLYPKINFSIKHNFKTLPFLDILIKNQYKQIIIDI